MIFAKNCTDNPIIATLLLVLIFGAIVLGVILIKKYAKPFQSDEKPSSAEESAKESLDRMLQPIEDEKTAKQVEDYKQEFKEKDDAEGEDKPL